MPADGRLVRRGAADGGLGVHPRAPAQQRLDHLRVAVLRRAVQRAHLVVAGGARLHERPAGDEEREHVERAGARRGCGEDDRAVGVLGVDVRAAVEKQAARVEVPEEGGEVERRRTVELPTLGVAAGRRPDDVALQGKARGRSGAVSGAEVALEEEVKEAGSGAEAAAAAASAGAEPGGERSARSFGGGRQRLGPCSRPRASAPCLSARGSPRARRRRGGHGDTPCGPSRRRRGGRRGRPDVLARSFGWVRLRATGGRTARKRGQWESGAGTSLAFAWQGEENRSS